jgi:hypothetical protein
MMNQHMEETVAIALLLSLLALLPGLAQSEPLVTISGVISEEGQLVGNDGVIYEIADTETGFELMELTDHHVKVVGQLMTTDEFVILIAETFEIIRK